MGRPAYTDTLDLLQRARESNPDLAIGVDVIAGFPGESDEHFDYLMRSLESLPVTYLHAFGFSSRPGTKAEKFEAKIKASMIKKRTKELIDLGRIKKLNFLESQSGKVRQVIPEKVNRKSNYINSITDNYIRVKLVICQHPRGELVKVKIEYEGKGVMRGESV